MARGGLRHFPQPQRDQQQRPQFASHLRIAGQAILERGLFPFEKGKAFG
jgi:hypothetical protein